MLGVARCGPVMRREAGQPVRSGRCCGIPVQSCVAGTRFHISCATDLVCGRRLRKHTPSAPLSRSSAAPHHESAVEKEREPIANTSPVAETVSALPNDEKAGHVGDSSAVVLRPASRPARECDHIRFGRTGLHRDSLLQRAFCRQRSSPRADPKVVRSVNDGRERDCSRRPERSDALVETNHPCAAVGSGCNRRGDGERPAIRAEIERLCLTFGIVARPAELRIVDRAFELRLQAPHTGAARKHVDRVVAIRPAAILKIFRRIRSVQRQSTASVRPSSLSRTPRPN